MKKPGGWAEPAKMARPGNSSEPECLVRLGGPEGKERTQRWELEE